MKHGNTPASEANQPVTIAPLGIALLPATHLSQQPLQQFQIIWIEQGNLEIEVNSHPLTLTNACACFLMPGQICQLRQTQNIRGYQIHISEDFFYSATAHKPYTFCHSNFINHPWTRQLEEDKAPLIHIILSLFLQECTSENTIHKHILTDWFKLLLNYLDAGHQPETTVVATARDQQIVQEFLRLLTQHFTRLKKVSEYAQKMAISPTLLNHIIKKASGHPASFHIQRYIIREAKRQALHTGKSMKEIAYELGFSDCSHFSKFFKNNTGTNFTSFKSSREGIM